MSTKQKNIIKEMYPTATDTFSNVEFRDNVVGNSTPSKDRINPALLKDVQTAASNAGIQVSITTAVSGHKKGSRHETGNAIDVAMINGKGWSGEKSAQRNGILDDINRFVSELEKLGYKKNVGETGNPKVVLTFGFKNHHHHVHVSNETSDSSQPEVTPTETQSTSQKPEVKDKEDLQKVLDSLKSSGNLGSSFKKDVLKKLLGGSGIASSIVDLIPENENKDVNFITEEINRIKNIIKCQR